MAAIDTHMTAHATNHIGATLAEIDERIALTAYGRLTLDPCRSTANRLDDLVMGLTDPGETPHLGAAAIAVADAQLRSFPENLFWDFDFFLASIHRDALASPDYADHLRKVTRVTVGLMNLYGQQSAIRFRYVHDFMYGFDWARWVRRDPGSRQEAAPFGMEFLQQSENRGRDILKLIDEDDALYPSLEDGVARNPFPFAREPEHELPLYRLLAERGEVPVETWRIDARPDSSRDFDALREEAAAFLGLSR
jgi:hypothetical protein